MSVAERRRALPPLSIVVPVKNELDNVIELIERLDRLSQDLVMEIIFVDDSDDGTGDTVDKLREHSRHDIRLICRPPEQRRDGLGGAVLEGLRAARSPWVCVMDGDLQHPPELISRLVEEAEHAHVDLVVATRYGSNGDAAVLRRRRRAVSRFTTTAARMLFPLVRRFSDPMSGFFLVRRAALDLERLRPRGFKVLLEILIRTPGLRASEVAFTFERRRAGKSKATIQEGGRYVAQLLRLRLARFGAVGASGLVVNTAFLAAFTELGHITYWVSAILATQASYLWNFSLTELWVFPDRRDSRSWVSRLVMFVAMNNTALLLRGPILIVLTSELGVYYLASNVISLVLLTLIRFGLSDRWIWATGDVAMEPSPDSHSYDIHGIATVESSVRLPELERFRVAGPIADPNIRVRVGRLRPETNGAGPAHVSRNGRPVPRIYYDEGLGVFSFGTAIEIDDRVEVMVTPVLRWSPHVLYTNIVEPILRWYFVEQGYALVHAACVAVGDDALLVTAKTDTGKTTTILRILDAHDHSFLSDDLVLVRADGQVLGYPKPLTISRHTLKAVKTPLLSWRERFSLLFQSRLHSRSGRRFAMFLANSRLPVATINTIAQLVIPPPKYHVERLVPGVQTSSQARAAHLVVIARGEDEQAHLDSEEAVQTLMSNSEDAFGFPPYSEIEHFLHSRSDNDLRAAERRIVTDAFRQVPAILIRSATMDWWREIPTALRGIEAFDPGPAETSSYERGLGYPPNR